MPRPPYSAVGIVLHLNKTGDSNRVVDVLCAEEGRVALLARGARASKKRFAGILDVFATLQLHIQPGRGMPTLVSADARATRLGIRDDLDAIMLAAELCKFVRALVPPQSAAPQTFVALGAGLDACAAHDLAMAAAAFVPMAAAAGILPDRLCSRCQRAAPELGLHAPSGTLVCRRCDARLEPLPAAVLAALQGAPLPDVAMAIQLSRLMGALRAFHADEGQRRR